MAFQVSPGVQVKEIDLTTVVPAVSTSIGGFAGAFSFGPVEKVQLVSSEDQLASVMGTPTASNSVDFLTAASFLAYAGALKVVRASAEDALHATSGPGGRSMIENEDVFDSLLIDPDVEEDIIARYVGAYGNSIKVVSLQPTNFNRVAVEITTSSTAFVKGAEFTQEVDGVVKAYEILEVEGSTLYVGSPVSKDAPIEISGDQAVVDSVVSFTPESSLFDASPSEGESHVAVVDEEGLLSGVAGTVLETYAFLSNNVGAKSEDGSNNYAVDVINDRSSFVYLTSVPSSGSYSLSGGTDGAKPGNDDYIRAYEQLADVDAEDVNLLIAGAVSATVAKKVAEIAETRKDAVAFISPLRDDVVGQTTIKATQNVLEFRNSELGLNTSYAVLDSGWKYMYNKYADKFVYVPLCADTAGLCARTDSERDAWFSPAGFNRGNLRNVVKLAYSPDQAQRDELYKAGINPVVNFKGVGPVLFGDKTLLVRPSAFDRINVRRLFIVLEKAISTAAQFSLFELNDQFTRAQFVSLVEPFLREVQSRSGITDFKVVCDETNNTPEVIDTNRFVGSIFIKPARSINFITLNFVAVRTGVDFSEVVGSV